MVDGGDAGAVGVTGWVVGVVGLAVGVVGLAVGVAGRVVGAGGDPGAAVTDGDAVGVVTAVVVFPVLFPPLTLTLMMTRMTKANPTQATICTMSGSDRKRRHRPGP